MKAAIGEIGAKEIAAHRDRIVAFGQAKNTEMRLRWDLLWFTVKSRWVCDNLYPYANDEHIDTALRKIMREQS